MRMIMSRHFLCNRYNSFKVRLYTQICDGILTLLLKVVSYYSVGYILEAAELGFDVYESRASHPKFVYISSICMIFHMLL